MHTGVAFLFLSVFSSAVHCAGQGTGAGAKWDLDTKITTVPAGSKFGLKMDYELAVETGGKDAAKASTFAKLFSSHVTFNKPVSTITDGEWAAMAIDAYWDDIILAKKQYGGLAEMQKFDPNVLVILSFGSEAYFSTSHKGASFAYNSPNSLVKEELAKCQKEFKDETGEDVCHKNNAQCGEVMAVQQYFVDKGKDLEKQKAKIIAVRRSQDKKTKAFLKPEVIDPCCTGSEDTWGCNKFIKEFALTAVPAGTKATSYDIKTIAGGIKSMAQVEVCYNAAARVKRVLMSRVARSIQEQ